MKLLLFVLLIVTLLMTVRVNGDSGSDSSSESSSDSGSDSDSQSEVYSDSADSPDMVCIYNSWVVVEIKFLAMGVGAKHGCAIKSGSTATVYVHRVETRKNASS